MASAIIDDGIASTRIKQKQPLSSWAKDEPFTLRALIFNLLPCGRSDNLQAGGQQWCYGFLFFSENCGFIYTRTNDSV